MIYCLNQVYIICTLYYTLYTYTIEISNCLTSIYTINLEFQTIRSFFAKTMHDARHIIKQT